VCPLNFAYPRRLFKHCRATIRGRTDATKHNLDEESVMKGETRDIVFPSKR
jgi:hypothetical protein